MNLATRTMWKALVASGLVAAFAGVGPRTAEAGWRRRVVVLTPSVYEVQAPTTTVIASPLPEVVSTTVTSPMVGTTTTLVPSMAVAPPVVTSVATPALLVPAGRVRVVPARRLYRYGW